MQLAVVEFSRNVLGWQDANSTEFDPKTNHPVVSQVSGPQQGQTGQAGALGPAQTPSVQQGVCRLRETVFEHLQVIDMPEHNPGQMGGTMRLGKRRTLFQTKNSVMRKLYGDPDYLEERHRHRFEVNPVLKKCLEEQGLKFVGQDVEGERMEIVELEGCRVSFWWEMTNKLSKFYRDTYSDRSGSSSPDSEITELKFPSINHD
ncbi:CTP synthase 1 [Galemys pyrenaicus]|uniref:CTP synthase (glutamine hydrolyzing) n=1 Tax=Galemys pyrenaicus TaxID=202257 RepID=A0A8J6DIV2_GALPY|nr:CTP synthase 1 [Galemys pyrenaicus]